MTEAAARVTVALPRSLVALFPGVDRRVPATGATVLDVIRDVDIAGGVMRVEWGADY